VALKSPWHPLIVALVPVATMYAQFPGAATPDEIVRSAIAVLGVTAALFVIAFGVYRDGRKAALFVTAALILFLAFDAVYSLVEPMRIGGIRPFRRAIAIPATYVAVLAGAWLLYRTRRSLLTVTAFVNCAALGCLLVPTATLTYAQARAMRQTTPLLDVPVAHGDSTVKPDIYYVIFDRYGDAGTMREYGLDNTPFYDYLQNQGFYVAPQSHSNYVKTVLSLASSLNMSYLAPVISAQGPDSENWWPVYDWIQNATVIRFLRAHGYKYNLAGSWYWPTLVHRNADRNFNYYTTVPRAAMRLLDTALMDPVRMLAPTALLDSRRQQWERVRRQIDDVIATASDPAPTFTFVHILVPHPPYVFDKDGAYLSEAEENRRPERLNYVNQVLGANAMARRLIEGIRARTSAPPVIILQGDEGPYPAGTTGTRYEWREANAQQLREKSAILNAYYLPGHSDDLYPTMTPVNTFRVVLNAYLGTQLPLLEDYVYAHESEYHPYRMTDITATVSATTEARAVDQALSSPR